MAFLVTITGATGRLGQAVVPLISKKYRTRLLVRDVSKAIAILESNPKKSQGLLDSKRPKSPRKTFRFCYKREFTKSQSELVEIDLTAASIDDFRSAVRGSTVVIHLAGLVDLLASHEELFAVNFEITKKLVAACEAEKIPFFFHASSISVYADSDVQINEESDKKPVTIYGESKLAAEQVVTSSKLNWVALRPGIIYGPHFKDGFLPLIEQMKKKRAAIIGTGENRVPLVYEGDVALAFLKCVDLAKAKSKDQKKILRQAFNVVGVHPTQRQAYALLSEVFNVPMPTKVVSIRFAKSFATLASVLAKFSGKRSAFPPEYIDLLARNRLYDVSKAKKVLGFVATTSVKSGMQEIRKAWNN